MMARFAGEEGLVHGFERCSKQMPGALLRAYRGGPALRIREKSAPLPDSEPTGFGAVGELGEQALQRSGVFWLEASLLRAFYPFVPAANQRAQSANRQNISNPCPIRQPAILRMSGASVHGLPVTGAAVDNREIGLGHL